MHICSNSEVPTWPYGEYCPRPGFNLRRKGKEKLESTLMPSKQKCIPVININFQLTEANMPFTIIKMWEETYLKVETPSA